MEALETFWHTLIGYGRWTRVELSGLTGRRSRRNTQGENGSRHLLVVASFLPPTVTGGVYRPLSWFRYGAAHGWRLSAVTYPTPDRISDAGRYLQEQIPAEISVRRIGHQALKPAWRWFPRIDGGFVNALAMARLGRRWLLADPPSAVVATGPYFSSFVAALFLARAFGARLVLDYRDEWTESPFEFIRLGNMDRYWEKRCLAAAHMVTFTTRSQVDHQVARFSGLNRERCRVVMNGWEPNDLASADAPVPFLACLPESALTVAFTGALGNHTLPGSFLACLRPVLERDCDLRGRLRLVFLGTRSTTADQELSAFSFPDNLMCLDHAPKPVANRLQHDVDALLILSSPDLARYLPGKLFDYLASGRPVLVYGHDGEAARLVKQLNAGWFVPEGDHAALAAALRDLVHDRHRATAERIAWCNAHTREKMAAEFFAALDGLCAAG